MSSRETTIIMSTEKEEVRLKTNFYSAEQTIHLTYIFHFQKTLISYVHLFIFISYITILQITICIAYFFETSVVIWKTKNTITKKASTVYVLWAGIPSQKHLYCDIYGNLTAYPKEDNYTEFAKICKSKFPRKLFRILIR